MSLASSLLSVLVLLQTVYTFYLPGVAPKNFEKGEAVQLLVNTLSSTKTVLPYDFYDERFHFCRPKQVVAQQESLGSILFGDRFYNSPFEEENQLQMLVPKTCAVLCQTTIPKQDVSFINDRINENYLMHWFVDGLPAGRNASSHYTMGFALGKSAEDVSSLTGSLLHNHFDLTIQYHTSEKENKYRVVGVLVVPSSIQTSSEGVNDCAGSTKPAILKPDTENMMTYSYSVKWIPSKTPWGTRWDHYLYVSDEKIHWFSVINSAVIVLILSGMVSIILIRALHKDISRYNSIEPVEDLSEEFGWKLVHGDVFRPPASSTLLCVLVGNGAQVLCMSFVTLVFAALGFLSPSSRGSLSTVMLVFYILFACIAGYSSARLFKMLGEKQWKQNVLLTSFLVPGVIFFTFVSLNFFLISAKSSAAVPFGTLFSLMALWFLVSAPLCFLGSYFGFKKPRIEQPVRTHQIPRQVPDQPTYLTLPVAMLLGGILPFGAMFIELFYIMNSVWSNRVFYVFGFLLLVYLILVLTTSLVSVILCYFQLCAENYNWWWRSFLVSGSTGIYVFIYGIVYYFTKLHMNSGPSTVLYFGYTFIMSLLVFLITGTIGFTACFLFVRKIYSSIKID